MIVFDDVSVVPPDSDAPILRSVNLRLSEQRVAIIGENGSGKSTLARMINGLVTATSGRVTVDELDPSQKGPAVRRNVGFIFTQPHAQLVMPTVIEDVALSLRTHIRNRDDRGAEAMRILSKYQLDAYAHSSVHSLSGGQQQLLALAGVLAVEPAIVVADEPTTLLDLRNSRAISDVLLDLNQQLILITHDLDLAARCERVILFEDGGVYYDGSASNSIARYHTRVART